MAPLRHPRSQLACLLTGEERKWAADRQNDAIDPIRTSATSNRGGSAPVNNSQQHCARHYRWPDLRLICAEKKVGGSLSGRKAAKPQSRRRFRPIGIFETGCDRGSEAATIMRYVARHKYHWMAERR